MNNLFFEWFKALFRWISILVMIPLLLIALILTPMGLKISFHIFSKLVPGHMQYQQVTGTLLGPIIIKKFDYRYEDKQVSFNRLYLQWRPSDLLLGRINVENLIIDSLTITTPKAPTPTTTYSKQLHDALENVHSHISSFHIPVKIKVDRALLNKMVWNEHPGPPTLIASKINLQNLDIEPKGLTAHLRGDLLKPYPCHITLTLNGSPQLYHFRASIENANTNWTIIGQGNPHEVELDTPQTTILGGQVAAHLHFLWQEHTPWQAIIRARQLNLTSINPKWPHPIDIDLNADGLLYEDQPVISWNALIKTPQSQVSTKGKYNKLWDISWNLQIQELAELLPSSSGVVISTGELHGSLLSPQTKGTLKAAAFRWHDYKINQLNANWNVDASEKSNSIIQLNAQEIVTPWGQLEKLVVNAGGKLFQHQLSLQAHGYSTDIQLKAAGSWQNNQWVGTIQNLILDLPVVGKWQSNNPAALKFSQTMIDLSAMCLFSSYHSQMCIHGKWEKTTNAWQAAGTGSLKFEEFASFAPDKFKINVPMDIHLNVEGIGKTLEKVQLKGSAQEGDITYKGSSPISVHVNGGQLQAQLNEGNLNIDIDTQFANNNSLSAKFVLPNFSQNQTSFQNQAIDGQVFLHLNNLDLFQELIPDTFAPKGKFLANLDINGTLGSLALKGKASLDGGELKLLNFNIPIEQIHLDLTGNSKELNYILSATSKNQPLKAEGKTLLDQPGNPTNITLTGNSILFADTSDYSIYVSPNLTFFIRGSQIDIGGSIDIPKGILRQLAFQNETTLPTGEVVFVGEKQNKTNPVNLNMDLTINLGKDARIDTPGIKGNLIGSLTLSLKPGQVLLGSGKIEINNGSYSVLGRELTIASGSSVIYRNTPLNNPFLNIQATTRIEVTDPVVQQQLGTNELTVGMNIGGSPSTPQITLFSSAGNLSQADILSFLLLGTSSAGISPYNMELMLKASQTLPLTKQAVGSVEGITNQVKQSLGLSELGVESAPTFGPVGEVLPTSTPTSYFVIGKRLTSRIYFRYRYDPFNSVNLFQLIYTITKNLSLQLETDGNTQSGADLLYTIQTGTSKAANKAQNTNKK